MMGSVCVVVMVVTICALLLCAPIRYGHAWFPLPGRFTCSNRLVPRSKRLLSCRLRHV